jgi:hypothetical protein
LDFGEAKESIRSLLQTHDCLPLRAREYRQIVARGKAVLTSGIDIKNVWSYTSSPPYAFTTWCFIKLRDNIVTISVSYRPSVFALQTIRISVNGFLLNMILGNLTRNILLID